MLGHNLGPTWCLGPKSHLERKRKGEPLRPGPKGRPAEWIYGQSGSFGQFRGKSRGQDPGPADFPPIRLPRGKGMRRAKQRARLPLSPKVSWPEGRPGDTFRRGRRHVHVSTSSFATPTSLKMRSKPGLKNSRVVLFSPFLKMSNPQAKR